MISHEQASEILGAYALDAVDGEELSELEGHLATCPRCEAELDGLREVAAAMGNSTEALPDGPVVELLPSSWTERPPRRRPPPMPRLVASSPAPFRAPAPGRTRRARRAVLLLGAVAVAASAVAVVLGIDLVRSQNNVTGLEQAAQRPRPRHARRPRSPCTRPVTAS